jgi:hypothetical protein
MKRIFSALVLLTLSAGGCSDDADDGDDTGGSSSAGTKSDAGEPGTATGGAPDSGGAGAPSANVGCDPEVDGVCQNSTDCPFVIDGTARMTAGNCGIDCLESDDEACPVDCIVEELHMTSDCATCYAGAVACATENCLGVCISDTEADECKQCQVEKGCREEFNTCSGLPE